MEKPMKGKGMWRESGGHESSCHSRGTGQYGEREITIATGFEEAVAGVGETRGAGIGNDGNCFFPGGTLDQLGDTVLLIVVVKRNERL